MDLKLLGTADADASGEYFDYSIDELGLQDFKAADRVVYNAVSKELMLQYGCIKLCTAGLHVQLCEGS